VLRFRFAILAILFFSMLSLVPSDMVRSTQAAPADLCFRETNQCITGRFREYWERNGGLAVFGFPTSPAQNELNRDTGQVYLTQWVERNRFELHPENRAPYDVLLGRLGDDSLRQKGIDWQKEPRTNPQSGCLYFETTGHNVCDQTRGLGFKTYWQTHGLEFDGRRGFSYQESLALFGLPLTEPRMETNASGDRVLTQWFERARFEWHPNNPEAFRVLLGLLGNELRSPLTPQTLPSNVPWVRTGNQAVAVADRLPTITIPNTFPDAPPPPIYVSPNGKRIAYAESMTQSEYRLVVFDLEDNSKRVFALDQNWFILGGAWAPNSDQFAYTIINGAGQFRYEFRVLDLQSGGISVRRAESTNLALMPIIWNNGGLFAINILWGSDAPPQGLFQVDPASGATQTILQSGNLDTAITQQGQKVAYIFGSRPISEKPESGLAVLDRATGQTKTLVPQQRGLIGNLDWTPDGTKLVHMRAPDYGADPATIHVTNADGSGEQIIRLDSGPFPGKVHDVAWRNNTTLLVLTGDGPGQLSVFEVPLSNFHPAAAKKLQTFAKNGNYFDSFVYVPR